MIIDLAVYEGHVVCYETVEFLLYETLEKLTEVRGVGVGGGVGAVGVVRSSYCTRLWRS